MKTALKKTSYWLSIAVVGVIVGISLQFAKAWTEPTVAPPNATIGAPITTGATIQTKAGNLGIGTTTVPAAFLHVQGVPAGGVSPFIVAERTDVNTDSTGFIAYQSSPSAPADNSRLGFMIFGSRWNGSSNNNAAIAGYAQGAWAAGSNPTYLNFATTPAGSTSRAERMRIDKDGNVGIGTTNPTAKLQIGGTPGVDGIKFPDGSVQTTAAAATSVKSLIPDGSVATAICSYLNSVSNGNSGNFIVGLNWCGQVKYSAGNFYTRVYFSKDYCATAAASKDPNVNGGKPIDSGWVSGDTASVSASNPWWANLYKATATRTVFGASVTGQDAIGMGSSTSYYAYGCSGSGPF